MMCFTGFKCTKYLNVVYLEHALIIKKKKIKIHAISMVG